MWTRLTKEPGGTALYKQAAACIEGAIESGLLAGGERLPSERRLCSLLGVNRSTIIHALAELTDRGVLLRRQGSGTYVNHEKWGLQQYPILNWQPPAALRTAQGAGEYASRVARRKEEARLQGQTMPGKALWDLAGSDLAGDLSPAVAMPELSWREVLGREMDAESSLLGLSAFREVVRGHLKRNAGLAAEHDEILITSGAQQALFLITQCLLRPGDAVGIEAPSYFYSLPVFQAAGLRLFAIHTDSEGIEPGGLDAVVSRRGLKMIFLNPSFQNPTGRVMSARRKEAVLGYCAAGHIPIVEDDAYSLLGFGGAGDLTPLKSLDAHGRVLYVGSLSSYMGKNIRAGWLVAPSGVIRRLAAVRSQIDANLSVLPQLLAGHYLETAEAAHRAFLQTALARRAAALQERLAPLAGTFAWEKPCGGFYLYLRAKEEARAKGAPSNQPDPLQALLDLGIIPAPGTECGDAEGRFRLNFSHVTV